MAPGVVPKIGLFGAFIEPCTALKATSALVSASRNLALGSAASPEKSSHVKNGWQKGLPTICWLEGLSKSPIRLHKGSIKAFWRHLKGFERFFKGPLRPLKGPLEAF